MAEREEFSALDTGHREEETRLHQHENRIADHSTTWKPDFKEQSEHYGIKVEQESADTIFVPSVNPLPELKPDFIKRDDGDQHKEDHYSQDSSVQTEFVSAVLLSEPKPDLKDEEYEDEDDEEDHYSLKNIENSSDPELKYGSETGKSWQQWPWSSLDRHSSGSKFDSRLYNVQHAWYPGDEAKPEIPFNSHDSYVPTFRDFEAQYYPKWVEPPRFDSPRIELPRIEPPKLFEPKMSDGSASRELGIVFGYVVAAAVLGSLAFVLCALMRHAVRHLFETATARFHRRANIGRAPSNMPRNGVACTTSTRSSIASNGCDVAVHITPEQNFITAKDDLPPSYMTCILEEELPPSYDFMQLTGEVGGSGSVRVWPEIHVAGDACSRSD